MKICPTCQNVYIMRFNETGKLFWECPSCQVKEEQIGGCLIMETFVQERSSEAYKIMYDEYTRQDATLPHSKDMKCPKETCDSNTGGAERDVIFIKYDPVNMKYMYICNVCGDVWRSRS